MNSDIVFLQTDVIFEMRSTGLNHQEPVFTIFGTLKSGASIQVHVHNFFPYFYVQPINYSTLYVEDLKSAIGKLELKGRLLEVESIMSKSIYGYQEDKSEFFKLTFNNPHLFFNLKTVLEEGIIIDKKRVCFKLFESNIPFVLRFMIDMNMSGMIYLKVKKYEVNEDKPLIISTTYDMIEALPLSGEHVILPPFKIMSLDIECISLDRVSFPVALKDPIIQIGCTLAHSNSKDFYSQDIFCLKNTAEIPGANVLSFETEEEMMWAWREYLIKNDPDIIIGYNLKGFDIPYILDRAEALGLNGFNVLGRTKKSSKQKETLFSSRQFGSIAGSEIPIEGRLVFDLMQIIRRDHKLRSYSLNSVSLHFLQEQKEDVPHSSMNELFETGPDTRRRIASYCLKDTVLPLRLFNKLDVLINFTELSRVTGVPIDYFSTRGTAIKVLTLIYKAAKKYGFIIPIIDPSTTDTTYEGGFVMDPERGFYSQPIAVLDFCSLYPSIMISRNLCYTTLLTKGQYEKYGGIKTPTNDYFAHPERAEGVLPKILKDLLTSRKATKREMNSVTDPSLKSCLNGRQLAFKLCANSIYGFTGATVGKLPCLEISQSTTSFGREMIAFSKKCIEETFCKSKGYSHDSQVIYGDTDSVMINFNESDMKKVFEMAAEVSREVTKNFMKPVALEFEKVYSPYLLINKKRYAGLIYTNPDKPSKIDTKGIETVRRDNCALVKSVIENSLNKILLEKDVEGAKKLVKDTVRDLYRGKIDLSLLVISKGITKSGDKYASKQAHIELAEKMKQRGDEKAGVVGNRVAYIMVQRGKKVAGYEKAEDPVYVLENNLPIDTEYYIAQQLAKPIHRLFEPIVENVSELLKGDHTRTISNAVQVKGPLNIFFKTTTTCVGCKSAGKIICDNCRKDFHSHLMKLQREVEEKKETFSDCWTECQRCQGSILDDILCENRDCPIFYRRTRVRKELVPLQKKLDDLRRFDW